MNANVSILLITLILTAGAIVGWDRYQQSQDHASMQQVSLQAVQAMRDVALRERSHKHGPD